MTNPINQPWTPATPTPDKTRQKEAWDHLTDKTKGRDGEREEGTDKNDKS